MHETQDGQYVPAGEGLLRGATASDVCLSCHATNNAGVFGPGPLSPNPQRGGGDFAFLLEDNLNDAANGAMQIIAGEAAGHSIVAPAQGLVAETRWGDAPGGSFPSAQLSCTSCHDPHGNANFRMLHGVGDVQGGIYSFTWPAPSAQGIDTVSTVESRSNHTAYVRGWENWCGNCHGTEYHDRSGSSFEHPSDKFFEHEIVDRYNAYEGDANPGGGSVATAYLPEVPFEDLGASVSSTQGPTQSSRLTCISCHRAHASSAPGSLRWDSRARTLGEDGVASGSYPLPNPYLAASQRSLCLKCHDEQHGQGRGCLGCHTR